MLIQASYQHLVSGLGRKLHAQVPSFQSDVDRHSRRGIAGERRRAVRLPAVDGDELHQLGDQGAGDYGRSRGLGGGGAGDRYGR